MPAMTTWLSEFKRRNVFRVGAVYLVVAWVVIQIADTVAPQLNLPDWAPRFITFVALLGFPIALVLAWILDLTPEGIKLEAGSARDKRIYVIAAVLVAAMVGWYYWERADPIPIATEARSIAVLPFVNMSGDADNEYFSDGISEELLNVLARNPGLRVAARTSSFAFKGQQVEAPEIARELDVELLVEGSVRRQAERVRITAQLIDAANGFHLWSKTYDRDLKDIFATQDDIATAIAAALKLELQAPDHDPAGSRTTDPAVYDSYLRARALFPTRHAAELRQAAAMLEEVISADPQFAEAYASLGLIYAVMPFYTQGSRAELHEKARNAAEHALALDPGLAEAYGTLGDVAIHSLHYDLAEALLRRAIEENPSLAAAHYWLAEKYLFTGEIEAANFELDNARELDPRSNFGSFLRSSTLLAMEQLKEARTACQTVLDSALDYEPCRGNLLMIALAANDLPAVRELLVTSPNAQRGDSIKLALAIADALEGKGDHKAVVRKLMAMPYHAVFDPEHPGILDDVVLPVLLLALDEPGLALERLALNANNEPRDVLQIIWDPQLDPIRCKQDFRRIAASLKVIDRRAELICPQQTD